MPNRARSHHYLRHRKNKDAFNYLVYFFMIATPLFELPQLIDIFSRHSASGISIWTWGFFLLSSVVWFIYSVRQKLIPIMMSNILYFLIEVGIVAGIIMYQ